MTANKFDATQKGIRIDNIPQPGTQTGNYEIDLYGCWWEFITDDYNNKSWIIGDYPGA